MKSTGSAVRDPGSVPHPSMLKILVDVPILLVKGQTIFSEYF